MCLLAVILSTKLLDILINLNNSLKVIKYKKKNFQLHFHFKFIYEKTKKV